MDDPSEIRATDAAKALIELGWPIVLIDFDGVRWQIGKNTFTNEEILEFATWAGIELSTQQPQKP
jgi:hypothetical protein